jgi:hypothetical protein
MHSGARGFLLVVFGTAKRTSAIAAVDPDSGEVLEAARLPRRESHTLITADDALKCARLDAAADARLVWEPSSASRSRLYPLWQLRNAERTVWVDSIRGVVWHSLDAIQGGG